MYALCVNNSAASESLLCYYSGRFKNEGLIILNNSKLCFAHRELNRSLLNEVCCFRTSSLIHSGAVNDEYHEIAVLNEHIYTPWMSVSVLDPYLELNLDSEPNLDSELNPV